MKTIIVIVAVAIVAVLSLASCVSCGSSPAPQPETPEVNDVPKDNVAIADSDSVACFEYQRREVNGDVVNFELFSWKKVDSDIRGFEPNAVISHISALAPVDPSVWKTVLGE